MLREVRIKEAEVIQKVTSRDSASFDWHRSMLDWSRAKHKNRNWTKTRFHQTYWWGHWSKYTMFRTQGKANTYVVQGSLDGVMTEMELVHHWQWSVRRFWPVSRKVFVSHLGSLQRIWRLTQRRKFQCLGYVPFRFPTRTVSQNKTGYCSIEVKGSLLVRKRLAERDSAWLVRHRPSQYIYH